MQQLTLKINNIDKENYFELYCSHCCKERKDKIKFFREIGLTKMFGWDKRLAYSCEGCKNIYFISYMTIYSTNFKGGFWATLQKAGWHGSEILVYLWNTNFFDGGNTFDIPDDKREDFEKQCKEKVAENNEIHKRIKEIYG